MWISLLVMEGRMLVITNWSRRCVIMVVLLVLLGTVALPSAQAAPTRVRVISDVSGLCATAYDYLTSNDLQPCDGRAEQTFIVQQVSGDIYRFIAFDGECVAMMPLFGDHLFIFSTVTCDTGSTLQQWSVFGLAPNKAMIRSVELDVCLLDEQDEYGSFWFADCTMESAQWFRIEYV